MKTTVIRHRVADFLKSHAPFDALADDDLLALAGSGRVKFHESDESIFEEGDTIGPMVWVIQQGRVELWEGGPRRDVLGAGDLLGLEGLAGMETYGHNARTATDVILYAVEASLFESMVARYDDVSRYLEAHFSLAGAAGVGRTSWLDAAPPPESFLRARFGVVLPITTRQAVRTMLETGTGQITAEGRTALTAEVLAMFCNRNPRHDRHTAGGDAFITAQVFLRLLRAAKRVGRTTVGALTEPYVATDG